MRKYLALLCTIGLTVLLAACGKSNTSNNLDYNVLPATPVTNPVVPGTQIGGSIQGAALNLTSDTAIVGPLAGTKGVAGFLDALGTAAIFNQPTGIAAVKDQSGNIELYVADQKNNVIRKIDSTGAVSVLQNTSNDNVAVSGPTDITVTVTVAADNSINRTLYVAQSTNHTVSKITLNSELKATDITVFGSPGTSGAVDSPNSDAVRFRNPIGVTTDGKNVFITDSGNNVIRWIDTITNAVHTLAGSNSSGTTDATGKEARFNLPARITTDGTNLYVTDWNSRTIRKIVINTAVVTTLAGKAGSLSGSIDSSAGVAGTFTGPNGITTDGSFLYVTDITQTTDNSNPSFSHKIRKIDLTVTDTTPDTIPVSTIAGGVSANFAESTDGQGLSARFGTPLGITTDGTQLYVVDSLSHTIRTIK